MKNKILNYWNSETVESMYDKNLLDLEINSILKYIPKSSYHKILDIGCGEGEGTQKYGFNISGNITAIDYSDTRLNKAKKRLSELANINFRKINLLGKFYFSEKFDAIISQRVLINLMSWENQKRTIKKLSKFLNKNGKFVMLEGSEDGVKRLNELRGIFNLKPILIKWHNIFIDDTKLEKYMLSIGFKLVKTQSFSDYFVLTRVIRPIFDKNLNWNCKYNTASAYIQQKSLLNIDNKISRLKLWIYQKV